MSGAWLEAEEDVIESRAQLRNRMSSLLQEGKVSEERHEEVLNALEAGTREIRDVMVDASDIVYLSTAAAVEENLQRVSETPHVRYPLIGEGPDDFVGIVYLPRLVQRMDELESGEVSFSDIAAPPMTVSASTTVSDAFDQFQAEGQELALVLADGDVVGLLTATDTLEAVMGELEDPLDRQSQQPNEER
jgi:CBS domain containing-hemolysin-like protein